MKNARVTNVYPLNCLLFVLSDVCEAEGDGNGFTSSHNKRHVL